MAIWSTRTLVADFRTVGMRYSCAAKFIFIVVCGSLVAFLPDESNAWGLAVMGVGFFTIVSVAYRSASRQHADGIFSQWTAPESFVSMKLNLFERNRMILGLAFIAGPAFGYALRLV